MSLYDDAVLVMIPSAFKATKLYSVKPTDGAGDFTVANGGAKFRTNSDLKLEEIAANVPALDYDAVGGCPTLKLNEANTNLLERPLSFGHSDWTKSGSTIEGDASTADSNIISGGDFEGGLIGTLLSGDETSTWTLNTSSPISGTNDGLLQVTAAGTAIANPRVLFGTLVAETYYLYTFDYKVNSGTCILNSINKGGGGSVSVLETLTESGTYSFYFYSIGNSYLGNNFDGTSLFSLQIDNVSVKEVTGYPSPSVTYPTDAYLFTATAGGGSIKLTTPLASAAYNNSWYVKRATGTGVVSLVDASDTDVPIAVTGGWQRFDANATGTQCGLKLATSGDAVYIAFAQTSAKTYAPTFTYEGTEGATSSMLADAITGGGDAATFASVNASGVLYAEGSINELTDKYFAISNGTNLKTITIEFTPSGNIDCFIWNGGYVGRIIYTSLTINTDYKIAYRWADGDFALYINGGIEGTASGTVPFTTEMTEMNMSNAGTHPFYGNTKQVAVYNYLTDAQMIELTTP